MNACRTFKTHTRSPRQEQSVRTAAGTGLSSGSADGEQVRGGPASALQGLPGVPGSGTPGRVGGSASARPGPSQGRVRSLRIRVQPTGFISAASRV